MPDLRVGLGVRLSDRDISLLACLANSAMGLAGFDEQRLPDSTLDFHIAAVHQYPEPRHTRPITVTRDRPIWLRVVGRLPKATTVQDAADLCGQAS
jgi:hypothetical protein